MLHAGVFPGSCAPLNKHRQEFESISGNLCTPATLKILFSLPNIIKIVAPYYGSAWNGILVTFSTTNGGTPSISTFSGGQDATLYIYDHFCYFYTDFILP